MSQEAGFGLRDPVSAVIPNGLDFEELDRIAEARAPESEKGTLTILTAGRFSDYTKGADLIYRAFASLRRADPNVFLLSIANSDRFSYLLRELPETSFRISDWLPRQEFLGALAAADLVVLPSRYEPFGLIAVEALAMGVPVLANCVGGLSEIVHHGVSGALSPAADGSLGLLLNLRSLIRDRGRLRRMGAAGAAFVRQEYNMDRISCLVDKAIRRSLIGHESPAAVVAGA
jgi:glycogen(starch) synthase